MIAWDGTMNAQDAYQCKYCGIKLSKFDYDTYNGCCGKCREILDWKSILHDVKEMEK